MLICTHLGSRSTPACLQHICGSPVWVPQPEPASHPKPSPSSLPLLHPELMGNPCPAAFQNRQASRPPKRNDPSGIVLPIVPDMKTWIWRGEKWEFSWDSQWWGAQGGHTWSRHRSGEGHTKERCAGRDRPRADVCPPSPTCASSTAFPGSLLENKALMLFIEYNCLLRIIPAGRPGDALSEGSCW